MNKKLIAIVVLVVLLGGGFGVYVHSHHKNKTNDQTAQNSSTSNGNASFAPVSTAGLSFAATITNSQTSGTQASIEYDGKNTWQYQSSQNGQSTTFIVTSDAYYTKTGDTWYKLPASQNSAFNPSNYAYTDSQLSGLKATSTYKGKESCGSGTCDVWSAGSNGSTSTLWIDSGSKRIVKAETLTGGVTSSITYEYKNVSIDVPTDAASLPGTQ